MILLILGVFVVRSICHVLSVCLPGEGSFFGPVCIVVVAKNVQRNSEIARCVIHGSTRLKKCICKISVGIGEGGQASDSGKYLKQRFSMEYRFGMKYGVSS